ncbi:Gp15 family bacteriophage protein [Enterorhabdus sp. P55]|uniref:Gp15 family bacteriophage protein n=1 Tax=Enterorhabdus sp. P55 TaxID=2304571 RepID=UPI00136A3A12|nr:Gp15 family bacteriophage protein [Enterorhabdus sp. P55]NBI31885.1 hypothetical protein [Enterorhabdus sp. P55]
MRSPSLTRETRHDERGRAVSRYEHGGAPVDVYDSARTALLVLELFRDESLRDWEKASLLPSMIFPDPSQAAEAAQGDPQGLLSHILWEAFGLDSDHTHGDEAPAFDWGQDAARIRASLLAAYGIDWDEASRALPFADMVGLLASLMETGESTPFSEAVRARLAKPPKATRHNKAERDAFAARRRHFALDGDAQRSAKAADDAMADVFAAGMRAARRG